MARPRRPIFHLARHSRSPDRARSRRQFSPHAWRHVAFPAARACRKPHSPRLRDRLGPVDHRPFGAYRWIAASLVVPPRRSPPRAAATRSRPWARQRLIPPSPIPRLRRPRQSPGPVESELPGRAHAKFARSRRLYRLYGSHHL